MKAFCGKEGEILEEKIMLATGNFERVKLACEFLSARLKNLVSGHDNIIATIKAVAGNATVNSVKTLADRSFLSVRQFERKFREFSGFSPKLCMRITRFNTVLNKAGRDKTLTDIAYDHGYYDQSHFIHDFKMFAVATRKNISAMKQ